MNAVRGRAQLIISIVAIFISLAAFVTAARQGIETRRHYHLSTRPILSFRWSFGEPFKGLELTNFGLGPALLDSFELYVDGKHFVRKNDVLWLEALRECGISGPFKVWVPAESGSVVPPGAVQQVVGLSKEAYDEAAWNALNEKGGKIGIKLRYSSVYGEMWELNWGKLVGE